MGYGPTGVEYCEQVCTIGSKDHRVIVRSSTEFQLHQKHTP